MGKKRFQRRRERRIEREDKYKRKGKRKSWREGVDRKGKGEAVERLDRKGTWKRDSSKGDEHIEKGEGGRSMEVHA